MARMTRCGRGRVHGRFRGRVQGSRTLPLLQARIANSSLRYPASALSYKGRGGVQSAAYSAHTSGTVHLHAVAVSAFFAPLSCYPTSAPVSLSTSLTPTALASASIAPYSVTEICRFKLVTSC
jgi:hypothetical protein